MKPDRDKLKQLATTMIGNLKSLEWDLQIYEYALAVFKVAFPAESVAFELAMAKAKADPRLAEAMHQKYDVPLAQLLERTSHDQKHEAAFLAYLQSWGPNKGPLH